MIIPARFNGPAGSANGGYAAGLFAQALLDADPRTVVANRAVTVTLRRPPPLETPLRVVRSAPGEVRVEIDGPADAAGGPVAEAVAVAGPDLADWPVPAPVRPAEAEAAAAAYPGLVEHPFPGCYVCGPAHPDGLRIFPGPVSSGPTQGGAGRTAAPFVPPADSTVATVWAALDCPGGWAVLAPGRPYLLGRMTAAVLALPTPDQHGVVVGELVTTSGRKAEVRTALYDPYGRLMAAARATWIAIANPTRDKPV
ncbi:hypothetical protein [Micromonospora sp. LOL_023]|uniref:hypothetical protein n=1 Tax=Micromonospora sp. LOL_023 TaxID=3345418 RepID=UPI003A88CF6A